MFPSFSIGFFHVFPWFSYMNEGWSVFLSWPDSHPPLVSSRVLGFTIRQNLSLLTHHPCRLVFIYGGVNRIFCWRAYLIEIQPYRILHVISRNPHHMCVYIYTVYIYISLFILRFLTCLAQVVHSVASCLYIETISLIPATPWSWRLFRALKLVTKRPWHKPLFAGTCSLYSTVYTSNYENADSIDVWKSEVWLLNFLR